MRIAVVSTPFVAVPPPRYGGTELVVHALVEALERLGHEVTVFATGDSRVERLRARFARPVWPPDPYAELVHARFAAAEIERGGFDVVHAHVPAFLAFADELPAPVVYTVHHAYDPSLARLYAVAPSVLRVAISARQALLAADPSAAVVHHGLDQAMYPQCGPGGEAAFFLGRMSWVKAPDLAVEAARRAGVPLFLAGSRHAADAAPEGWHERVLEPALRAPGVTWLRAVDLAAKRALFARSRALLVPLRWEEPFGLVMIEALLAGCPVIAERAGAAPEIVEDGTTGFLVSGPVEMAVALRHAPALDRRAIQARARARFSAHRMAEEYLAVYRQAIGAGVPDAARSGRRATDAEVGDAWTTLAP